MIKDIIFDWGGVLGSESDIIAAKELSLEYGIDEKELYTLLDDSSDIYYCVSDDTQYYKGLSEKLNIPSEVIKHFINTVPAGSVFLLAKYCSEHGYRVHILSNQTNSRTEAIRKNNDLGFFTKAFFSNEIKLRKPDPKVFEHVLSEIERKPEQCIFIDDYSKNTDAAKKLGFNTILFRNVNQLTKALVNYGVQYK